MSQPNIDQVQFVKDAPSPADEFQGGAHDRVASALVNVLTTSTGGRAIGLEGSWGSGKSTVIDIASTKLKAYDDHTKKRIIFVFDAWAHQGDPILRVFLDQLISRLEAAGAINQTYWQKKLEKIRSRRKTTTENRSEKLTRGARIAILFLPLFPVAYLLAKETPTFLQVVAGIIISIPYLFLGGTWLSWRNIGSNKGKWYETKEEKRVKVFFGLLRDKQIKR